MLYPFLCEVNVLLFCLGYGMSEANYHLVDLIYVLCSLALLK